MTMKKIFASLAFILLLVPSVSEAMVKPVFGVIKGTSVSATTRYFAFDTGSAAVLQTTYGPAATPMSTSGTVTGLSVTRASAPGVGTSYAFTLWKNGSGTGLTCTTSGAVATTCTDPTNSVSYVPGDTLAWESLPTGSPAAGLFTLTAIQTGTNPGEVSISGGTGTANNSLPSSNAPYGGTYNTGDVNVSVIMPTSGTIDNLYVNLPTAPAATTGYTITVFKNGVASILTAAMIAVTSNNDTTHSVSYVAGDTIAIRVTPTNTPTAMIPHWSFRWRPTVDGESPIWGKAATLNNAALRYGTVDGEAVSNATEASVSFIAPTAFTLSKMYIAAETAPGSGKSFTTVFRNNAADKNLTAVLANTSTTTSDLTHSDSVSSGDVIDWSITPSGTPTVPFKFNISALLYIAPAVVAVGFGTTLFGPTGNTFFGPTGTWLFN